MQSLRCFLSLALILISLSLFLIVTFSSDIAIAEEDSNDYRVPSLERVPASNLRLLDPFDVPIEHVIVDQQVMITVDLSNKQNVEQSFAYIVEVQDENGSTDSFAIITGSLVSKQSFRTGVMWTPTTLGSYTAMVFVWSGLVSPTALSPPTSMTINVLES